MTAIAGLVGLIIPLVTALLVQKYADRKWFVLVSSALAIITGAVTTLAQGSVPTDWTTWALGMVVPFITSVTSYYGIHLPVGTVAALSNAVPGGIGTRADNPINMATVARTEQVGVHAIPPPAAA